MFTVQYEPVEAEVRANLEINSSAPRARRIRLVEWGIAVLMIVAGVALLASGSGGVGVALVVVGALVAIVLVGARALAKAGTRFSSVPTTVAVADHEITITRLRGQRVTPWHTVRAATENHLGWSLMGKPPVGFLPRSAFTPDQQTELAALIARHVGAGLRWAGPAMGSEVPSASPSSVDGQR